LASKVYACIGSFQAKLKPTVMPNRFNVEAKTTKHI